MAKHLLPCARLRTLNEFSSKARHVNVALADAAFDKMSVSYVINDLGVTEDASPLYVGGSLRVCHDLADQACKDYKQSMHFDLMTERQVRDTGACPFPLLRLWERTLGRTVLRSCIASTLSKMSDAAPPTTPVDANTVDDLTMHIRSWDKPKFLHMLMTIASIDTYARTMIWVDMVNRAQGATWSKKVAEAFAAELRTRLKSYSMLSSLDRVVRSTESGAKNEARFHAAVRKATMGNVVCRTIARGDEAREEEEGDDEEEGASQGVAKKRRCA